MKKLFLLLLLLGLVACGSDSSEEVTVPDVETTELEENIEEEEVEGTLDSLTLYDITYPEEFIKDNESVNDSETHSYASYHVMDGPDSRIIVSVEVSSREASTYRKSLNSAGVDIFEMVENNVGEFVEIAGINMLVYESEYWGDTSRTFIGRDEKSSMSFEINVTGDIDDPVVEDIISTISLKVEDKGLSDPPWYWEGERLSLTDTATVPVGNFSVTSQYIPFEESVEVFDIFSGRLAKGVQDTYWFAVDGKLYEYKMNGNSLSKVSEKEIEIIADEISADKNGNIYVSSFIQPLVRIDASANAVTLSPDVTMEGDVAMHPDGAFGLSYFYGSNIEKVTPEGDTVTVVEFLPKIEEFTYDMAAISSQNIMMMGRDDINSKIRVLDLNGQLKFTLGGDDYIEDDDAIGSVTEVIETANGFIALDGNSRSIMFWDKNGNFIANIDDEQFFGTDYSWLSDMILLDDGSILVCFTDGRVDESGDELMVYRLTGF